MNTQADLQKAMTLHQAGRLNEAADIYRKLIAAAPNNFHALHYLGVIEASAGRFNDAKKLMARSLAIQPPQVQFFENYATVLFQAGDYQTALQTCEQGARVAPGNPAFLYVSAVALFKLGRLDDALAQFDKILAAQPNHVEAINERGSVLAELKRHEEALASFDRALSVQAKYAPAHLNKGNLYGALKRYDEALAAYDKALAIEPRYPDAWVGHGNISRALKRYEEALAAYDKALAIHPNFADAWYARGNILRGARRFDEALAAYDKALSLNSRFAEAHGGRGFVLIEMNRPQEAFAAFDAALAIKPDLIEAVFGRGNALRKLARFDDAIAAFDHVLALDPKLDYAEGTRLYVKAQLCDWSNYDSECAHLIESVRNGIPTAPFQLLAISSSSADRLACSKLFAADNYPVASRPMWPGARATHDRIRIAYLSSDLRDHPVGTLMAGLFEQHDRSRFEITAISLGLPSQSPVRDRIKAAAEHFVDTGTLNDAKITALIREREIDIAVDLNGYTEGSRQNVFAMKPAPVQASYLGYACTMGSELFDYLIADRIAIPAEQRQFFCEKIVWLPGSFMVNDSKRRISEKTPSRAECGLPEKGFVFCCFNNTFKIAPGTFRIWMNLLKTVEGSVLWLSQANAGAVANLRREAQTSGVAPERLIFAARVADNADHLARQKCADLFLDTLPYNAHATTADSLWAGLPALTCAGTTFSARVAASLLNAVGLPEMVVHSSDDYEALALKIARDPSLLASLKGKLARNRLSAPLFDTARFARNIEAAYLTMWERHQAGQPPDHFAVEERKS